jgi:hypothetical protein
MADFHLFTWQSMAIYSIEPIPATYYLTYISEVGHIFLNPIENKHCRRS